MADSKLPGWQPKEKAAQLPQEGELSKQRGWHQCTKGSWPKNPAAQEVKGVAAPLASTWLLRQLLGCEQFSCVLRVCTSSGKLLNLRTLTLIVTQRIVGFRHRKHEVDWDRRSQATDYFDVGNTTIVRVTRDWVLLERYALLWMGRDAFDGHCFHLSEEGNVCFDVVRIRVLMAFVEEQVELWTSRGTIEVTSIRVLASRILVFLSSAPPWRSSDNLAMIFLFW